jgi:cardiolipin synthase
MEGAGSGDARVAGCMTALFSDDKLWLNVFFAAEWAVRLTMIVIVPFRRSPDAAKGWLLLIFFEPTIGLILYGLIGRPTLPAWRAQRHIEFEKLSRPIFERLAREPNIFQPDVGPELNKAVRLAEALAELPILGGNAIEVLADYDGFVDRLIADIEAARDHVHLLFYIVADDATTQRVIEALQHATDRGVVCRLLADSLGSRPDFERLLPRLEAAGILAEETMRVGLFHRAGRLDLRNHRKIVVIDGRVAYAGSQNLVDSTFKPGLTYEELNVRLAGPIALELQAVFAEDWYVETGEFLGEDRYVPDPDVQGNVAAQALPSGPGYPRENNQRLIVSLIHAANLRVFITMPYLVPDDALLQALQTAALRGVDVTLVVPLQIDQYLVGYGQRSYYDDLMGAGVRICRYGKRFLHAKCVTIDDTIAWVGSSNLDIRSFALNAEIVVLMYDTSVYKRLAVEEERYLRDGEMLELERWRQRQPLVKLAENLARLLSPLL